jgi:hypothetical protein
VVVEKEAPWFSLGNEDKDNFSPSMAEIDADNYGTSKFGADEDQL